jgi:hypothetical protein
MKNKNPLLDKYLAKEKQGKPVPNKTQEETKMIE